MGTGRLSLDSILVMVIPICFTQGLCLLKPVLLNAYQVPDMTTLFTCLLHFIHTPKEKSHRGDFIPIYWIKRVRPREAIQMPLLLLGQSLEHRPLPPAPRRAQHLCADKRRLWNHKSITKRNINKKGGFKCASVSSGFLFYPGLLCIHLSLAFCILRVIYTAENESRLLPWTSRSFLSLLCVKFSSNHLNKMKQTMMAP